MIKDIKNFWYFLDYRDFPKQIKEKRFMKQEIQSYKKGAVQVLVFQPVNQMRTQYRKFRAQFNFFQVIIQWKMENGKPQINFEMSFERVKRKDGRIRSIQKVNPQDKRKIQHNSNNDIINYLHSDKILKINKLNNVDQIQKQNGVKISKKKGFDSIKKKPQGSISKCSVQPLFDLKINKIQNINGSLSKEK